MKLRRLFAPLSALALGLALMGCSGGDATSPARYGLNVAMSSMGPHVGHLLELRVVHVESGVEVGYARVDSISTTEFTVSVPDVLIAGETYWVDFYADFNMNQRYDDPPVDHAWRRVIASITGNTSLSFVHDVNFTDIDFPPRG